MRYTIEGFSQIEALKFKRIEIVKDSKGNDKEKVVTLDCTDLVILRWFVDFWPNMMKVEIDGRQYAWLSYKAAIEDMPLLGIKKAMFALRLKKMVDFGILSHQTVTNGGTFSYYGFGPEYMRLVDSNHAKQSDDPLQNIVEGVSNKLETPLQKISDQIDPNTKDPSTTQSDIGAKPSKTTPKAPTREEVRAYVEEKGYHFDPDELYDYYDASNWHLQGGKKITSWKQCCTTWERNATKYGDKRKVKRVKRTVNSEPKVGSKRYNSTTDVTEIYKGNGVWEIEQPTLFEGERYEDIPYDL